MKTAVVGSRNFKDYQFLLQTLHKNHPDIVHIVSGGQRSYEYVKGLPRFYGADFFAEKYAQDNEIPITIYPAKWKKYGKSAGFKRNLEIAGDSDIIIAFWDGKSKGTKHTIDIAKNLNKKVFIYEFRS